MQVANTLNNTIRILFNPKVEAFKLFDFLVVKSDDSKYIAQIVEIYDDKFDASQNVAKIRLFYQITENDEVLPYDNFTPNKECEIIKIKQDEIEDFINQDKETFIFGTNTKNSCSLKLQYNFFNNNAVVLADKIENANAITLNLAKNLSQKRNVIIIDQTGVIEFDEAKKIQAGKNFKMPLNYSTIDNVFDKCLNDASLEFQAIGGEIVNEIKKFARKQESEFIPFNHLTRVLIQQYKATPYPELKLLLVRLKRIQMNEIFAKTKNDKDNLFKAIEKNPITIVDLSEIEPSWQKAYLDYIISDVNQEIYMLARINDEHFDSDLIHKIYCKKRNIKFVPNVSYSYKRLPSVMQYCKNYILLPSLFQRQDFLDANFALSNLILSDCIIFGQNTDNFIYLATDYELENQEKRKNYKKIALTLAQQDQETEQKLGANGDYFENQEQEKLSDSEKLIKELADHRNEKNKADEQEYIITNAPDEDFSGMEEFETFDVIQDPAKPPKNNKTKEETPVQENLESEKLNIQENTDSNENTLSNEETITEELSIDNVELEETSLDEMIKENSTKIETETQVETQIETTEIQIVQEKEKEAEQITLEQEHDLTQKAVDEIFENPPEEQDTIEEQIDISDEELDFFQMAQETASEYDDEAVEKKNIDIKQEENIATSELIKEEVEIAEVAEVTEVTETTKTEPEIKKEVKISETISISETMQEIEIKEETEEKSEAKTESEAKEIKEEIKTEEKDEIKEIKIEEPEIITESEEVEAEIKIEETETEPEIKEAEIEEAEVEFKIEVEPEIEEAEAEEKKEPKTQEASDDIDLNEFASKSLDNSFEQIINSKPSQNIQTIAIDENKEISEEILATPPKKENLPIFTEKQTDTENNIIYEIGNTVKHKKYGIGKVVKTIKYENRQLLQIEFGEAGKKLLDPKVAEIELE